MQLTVLKTAQESFSYNHKGLTEQAPLPELLTKRDEPFIKRFYKAVAGMVDYYYRCDVEGAHNLRSGASLLVSTHNGGMHTPDAYCLMVAFWRRFGTAAPAYGLMHRQAFRVPFLGSTLTRIGAVPASPENAATILNSNYPCMVCPGGDLDALKPFGQRHKIVFGNRMGFIKVAIRHQVPIVPAVSVGAHETLMILNDGRRLAEISGAARLLRIKSIPLGLSFPFGITPAGIFSLPLPSKVTLKILSPIELHEHPNSADNPAVVQRCFDHVREQMQASLDELARKRRYPLLG